MFWDIVLIVVVILLAVFAVMFEQYRFKSGRSIGVGMIAGGLAAFLAVFEILRHIWPIFLARAGGGHHWVQSGFVRLGLMVAIAIVIGFWVWFFDRRRYARNVTRH